MALMVAKVVPTAVAEAEPAIVALADCAKACVDTPPLATDTTKAPAALRKSRRDVPLSLSLWFVVVTSEVFTSEFEGLCMVCSSSHQSLCALDGAQNGHMRTATALQTFQGRFDFGVGGFGVAF
jgi:hypothetical protein